MDERRQPSNPAPAPRGPVRGERARTLRIKPAIPRIVWAVPAVALAAFLAVVGIALSEEHPDQRDPEPTPGAVTPTPVLITPPPLEPRR